MVLLGVLHVWPEEECVMGGFVCKSDRGLSISLAVNVHF
jgi:hypothetical protein